MRLPSGYGSVVKLSGKRRRPFAVRTSNIQKYINVYIGEKPVDSVLNVLKRFKFTYKRKHGYWTAIATDKVLEWADTLDNIDTRIEYRQTYIFHEYFAKRDDALKYLATLNNGSMVKEHVKLSVAPTFAKVYEEMIAHMKSLKRQLSNSSYLTYQASFNILANIHHIKIDALRPIDIQAILNANNSKSKSMITHIKKVLNKVENYAFMQHYITDGYMKYLIFEHTDSKEKKHSAFTDEEILRLWDNADNPLVTFALITIYTGLRPSELLGIKTKNIHLDEHYMIGGMKTEAGIDRTIPIADRIFDLVSSMYDPDNQYFYQPHWTYNNIRCKYNDALEKLSMKHIPHDGRHTFATLMDRYGANQICTKIIMGHSLNGNITEGVYTHKTLDELLDAVNLIKI